MDVVGEDTIVYPVRLLPPLSLGAVHSTVAVVLDADIVGVPIVGAFGVVYGVTELLASEDELFPAALTALTVNVYDVP